MTTRHACGVSAPPNMRPATGGSVTSASERGVNAATSITTSRSGNCGGSMRSDCHAGRLPGSVPTHAVAEMSGSDCAACSDVAEVLEAEIEARLKTAERASSVARIGWPRRWPTLVCSAARKPSRRRPVEITSRQQHVICATTRPARRRRIAFDGPALSR